MYREEVDELVAMFEQSCGKVTISDSKHRFDDLDDMKRNTSGRITDFDLRGENPGVRFLFNQTEIMRLSQPPAQTTFNELRTEELTDTADALFYKVKDFLITHQRPQVRKGFICGAIISFVGLLWIMYRNLGVDKQGQQIIAFRALPGMLVCIAALVFFVVMAMNVKNYLSLETRRNSVSFFVKYREDFAKHAVTATISGIIGAIFGWLVGHFLK